MAIKDFDAHLDKQLKAYHGDVQKIERAAGVYMIGKRVGYKVMLLMHDKRTLRECEELLGISLKDELAEVGQFADKSLAWRAAQKVSNFWKAVKGEISGVRSTAIK